MSKEILPEKNELQVEDQEVDLSSFLPETWVAIALFCLLGLTVFYQFFTRYVLNDSAAWTEEIARYLLIGTVFVGACIGVVKNNHIHVDLLYRFFPRSISRSLATAVDVVRVAFFAIAVVLTGQMMYRIGDNARMTVVDLPMNVVYGVCLLAFAAMLVRSLQLALIHWRRGYTVLERPELALES